MSRNNQIMLQASRGAAACVVLLFHLSSMSYKYFHYNLFGLNGLDRSGGVDYFFVLTGFLMYWIYGDRIGSRMDIRSYTANRLLRIYPLHGLLTLLVIPVYFLIPGYELGFETQPDAIFKSLLLIPQEHGPILGVAWSLSYFVLFYGVFALLMAINRRSATLLLSIWVCVIVANALQLPVIGPVIRQHFYLNFLFDSTNLELLAGCAAAYWLKRSQRRGDAMNSPSSLLWSGLIGFPLLWILKHFGIISVSQYLWYLPPSLCVLIGLATGSFASGPLPRWTILLSRLGDASYTILLTHLLSISVLMKLAHGLNLTQGVSPLWVNLIILIAALFISYQLHLWVEKPLMTSLRTLLPTPRKAHSH
ncbi:acyltransferase family protein [Paenibacillus chartarius]|uniref:Acyltransferase family protein n=1 Tax=Paenibacillus chartarius TaxID=747481 RepID=A0ABV6DKS6_9BACL